MFKNMSFTSSWLGIQPFIKWEMVAIKPKLNDSYSIWFREHTKYYIPKSGINIFIDIFL